MGAICNGDKRKQLAQCVLLVRKLFLWFSFSTDPVKRYSRKSTMSNANIDNVLIGSAGFVKKEGTTIKSEYDSVYDKHSDLTPENHPPQYYQNNDHACYYSPTSTVPNTILITNNYTQDGRAPGINSKNANKSSITIVTHNSDAEHSSSNMPSSAAGSTVVLDRINICINNHFNDSRTKNSLLPEAPYLAEVHKERSTEPDSTTSPYAMRDVNKPLEHPLNNSFLNGEDVLVQRKDGRFYLGTIVAIGRCQCLIKFDDNTEYWSNFDDLSKLSANDIINDPMCVVCKKASKSDVVEVCERCGRGYHPKCAEGSFQKNGIWFCRRCTAPNGLKFRSIDFDDRNSSGFQNLINQITHKSQLPYNPDSLSWDEHHRVNLEQIYCYCGKNGEWYNKMLQCCKCQQWFHENCVSCLTGPIYAGDLFYVFACTMCNEGKEFLRRLEMKWNDVVHLLLFNITVNKNKKYYHADNVIVPYAIDNWPLLQLQPNMRSLSAADIRDNVIRTLSMNNSRFKCGREIKKGQFFWGLRSRIPPPAPKFVLLPEVEISDQYLVQNTKLNIIQPKSLIDIPKDIDEKMTGTLYLGENSDNESSSASSDQKFTSDDELPIKRIIEREKIEIKEESRLDCTKIDGDRIPETTTPVLADSDKGISTGFSSLESSDKSRDCVDYEGTKEESMDVEVSEEVKNDKIHIKHSRKRKSPFFSTVMKQAEVKCTDVIDICDSSDESSSRGTLDLIIPPPKNFQGKNNPFRLTPKKKESSSIAKTNEVVKPAKKLDISGNLFKSDLSQSIGQFRIVRTVKRRLSAKDIMIGPNKEIKRRRLRRRSGNVEVISTTTLQSLPKSAAYLPIRTDSKELPVSAIRSTLHSASSSTSSTATTPTNLGSISNVFSGRRLRQRQGKNYSESQRRNSNSSVGTVCSNNGSGISIPGSPNKSGNQSDVSLSELKTSVNMYFGAAYRIASGESFVVRAKRLSPSGKVQYLIEWEGIS